MRVLIVSVCIVVADQITKLLVKGLSIPEIGIRWEGMRYGSSTPVFGDFLRWTYIENAGMAFGIDPGGGRLFFSIFSIVASVAILVYLIRARRETVFLRLPLALILGGAVGNLIDRMFYGMLFDHAGLFAGRVVDFIDVQFINLDFIGVHLSRWPVFNIADASVTLGVILLLVFSKKVMESTQEGDVLPARIADRPGEGRDPEESNPHPGR